MKLPKELQDRIGIPVPTQPLAIPLRGQPVPVASTSGGVVMTGSLAQEDKRPDGDASEHTDG